MLALISFLLIYSIWFFLLR